MNQNEEIDYSEYYALCDYDKRRAFSNNFWKIANGIKPINIPEHDRNYWEYWNEEVEKRAKEIFERKKRLEKIKEKHEIIRNSTIQK